MHQKVQNNKILTFAIATEERTRLRVEGEPTGSVKSTPQKLNTDSLSIQVIDSCSNPDHLESRLVNDVEQVLGVDCESVSRHQHVLLIVLL